MTIEHPRPWIHRYDEVVKRKEEKANRDGQSFGLVVISFMLLSAPVLLRLRLRARIRKVMSKKKRKGNAVGCLIQCSRAFEAERIV